ncbi:CxxxxCH/CxxCH domain-containing protein [Citricoccus nitrophenolicus]
MVPSRCSKITCEGSGSRRTEPAPASSAWYNR